MKIETEKLSGIALDWAVADCVDALDTRFPGGPLGFFRAVRAGGGLRYSTVQDQGGKLIEDRKIDVYASPVEGWKAVLVPDPKEPMFWFQAYGPTTLIAAMRCLVKSARGDEVEVPDKLLEVNGPW